MAETKYRVRLTFVTELLGTAPKDRQIYTTYIASKTEMNVADELATVPGNVEERGWTGFHTTIDGQPVLYDYVIKGFFKDACGVLRRMGGSLSAGLKAYKKVIDGLLFVEPRQIPLILPAGTEMGVLERPLRAQTAQGERVTVARSDVCPAGAVMEFEVTVLGEISEGLLQEWLDYGRRRGLGQWRNGGYGRFAYVMERSQGAAQHR